MFTQGSSSRKVLDLAASRTSELAFERCVAVCRACWERRRERSGARMPPPAPAPRGAAHLRTPENDWNGSRLQNGGICWQRSEADSYSIFSGAPEPGSPRSGRQHIFCPGVGGSMNVACLALCC